MQMMRYPAGCLQTGPLASLCEAESLAETAVAGVHVGVGVGVGDSYVAARLRPGSRATGGAATAVATMNNRWRPR